MPRTLYHLELEDCFCFSQQGQSLVLGTGCLSYSVSIPIDLAVPAIIFFACSMSFAFRSSIFSFAMSSSCFFESFPTLFCAFSDPFSMPSFFKMRRQAGRFLTINVNEPSL